MQERKSRAIAIFAAACVLLAHLISLRHETTVAHVRDSVGAMEHAHELAEYHETSTTPHLHGNGAEDHADLGPCALLVGLEQSTVLSSPPALAASIAAYAVVVELAPLQTAGGVSILAFAPKTSPPSIG
jgi:hypothetical protein